MAQIVATIRPTGVITVMRAPTHSRVPIMIAVSKLEQNIGTGKPKWNAAIVDGIVVLWVLFLPSKCLL